MGWAAPSSIGWLFDAQHGAPDRLIPRSQFLRALGSIYFSAFFSLFFQIRGLISPNGILPADSYLNVVAQSLGGWQREYAPTLLWWSSGPVGLKDMCWGHRAVRPRSRLTGSSPKLQPASMVRWLSHYVIQGAEGELGSRGLGEIECFCCLMGDQTKAFGCGVCLQLLQTGST